MRLKYPGAGLRRSRRLLRMVFTNRSACGLQFGLCAGIGTHSTLLDFSSALQAFVKSGSRSWIRWVALRSNPSTGRTSRGRIAAKAQSRSGRSSRKRQLAKSEIMNDSAAEGRSGQAHPQPGGSSQTGQLHARQPRAAFRRGAGRVPAPGAVDAGSRSRPRTLADRLLRASGRRRRTGEHVVAVEWVVPGEEHERAHQPPGERVGDGG
jgi:hypothetical protein